MDFETYLRRISIGGIHQLFCRQISSRNSKNPSERQHFFLKKLKTLKIRREVKHVKTDSNPIWLFSKLQKKKLDFIFFNEMYVSELQRKGYDKNGLYLDYKQTGKFSQKEGIF